ncbi:MAG: hypothetical protein AVDCRST_MAG90-1026, partial [uncultured Microvirga sp.]
ERARDQHPPGPAGRCDRRRRGFQRGLARGLCRHRPGRRPRADAGAARSRLDTAPI